MAVVLISSEIPELILNAERVLVLRAGRIAGELGRAGSARRRSRRGQMAS